jgi:GalNAc-alpha-(1->4)-GalNAc-alpha-(1->3)-diNAcBac-PP-undecaprenol alpha-1,4-N-acetyl-D-galactosaminyltransferase
MSRTRLRIVMVIGSLKPGGAERVLSLLANELYRSGHVVSIVTIKPGTDVFELESGVQRVRLSIAGESTNPLHALRLFFQRGRLIRDGILAQKPDCVLSFLDVVNVRVLIALWRSRVPVFVSERNTIHAMKGRLWPILRRCTYPRATGLIVQTERQAQQFHRYNRNIVVIPNPLVLPEPPSFNAKEPIILLVGRMNYQKQFDTFLDVMSKEDLGEFRITIVGEHRSPMIDNINRILSESSLRGRVEISGHIANIADYYSRAAVFVLPSLHEGFPNALSEALSYGCSCVSFDCPTGPAELITDGHNGILVPDQDWDAMKRGVLTVIRDRPLRQRFFHNAVERQAQYALPNIAERWENLFRQSVV